MTGYFPIRLGMQVGNICIKQCHHSVRNILLIIGILFKVDVIPMFGPFGLPKQFKLLPENLKALGYSTNIVGK